MIGNDWDVILKDEFEKPYFVELIKLIQKEYAEKTIFPKQTEIFNAFRNTPYKDVKVVILGQDPYHGVNEAEGLSFSVKVGIRKPPSLMNIFKELHDDLGCDIPEYGSLVPWAKRGVLLLNTVLTVEKDKPASHKGYGWENFTDSVIEKLNEREEPIVFILWGSFARSKKSLITNPKHCIIESPHPSPFSARNGFFGSRPFSKANHFLKSHGMEEVEWSIKPEEQLQK